MRLKSIKKIENDSKRYDIQTSSQNFYANNILVHNSLLIVSKYKGELICRTRGTVDARQMANGHEIDELIKKHYFFETLKRGPETYGVSYLFEWTTPNNIIVLREHNEPTLTLVGSVANDYDGCEYATQSYLDCLAEIYGFDRPQKYEYDSIEECLKDVAAWKGKEGVVLYSPDGQTLKKIKADEYCELHKICTGIKNINQVLDLFMTTDRFTKYEDFYKYIEMTIDYEVAERLKDDLLKIVTAYNKVLEKMKKVDHVIDGIRGDSFTRKDQAMCITQHWSDWRKSYGFVTLDNKVVEDKLIKAAIESEL